MRVLEAERIERALDVAVRAGRAVPEPSAADSVADLEHPDGEPLVAEPLRRVETAEAGTGDDDVEVLACHSVRHLRVSHPIDPHDW
jgi:hypothetical protein